MLKGVPITSILYINFEDERLELKTEELDLLLQAYQELYPEMLLEGCSFFFDEIQNIAGWEKFVLRIYDRGTKNIFLTGLNARFLSSDPLVDRELGERKVYVIDTGLLNALDFKFSDDTGKALEQAVFLELKSPGKRDLLFQG